MLQSHVPSFPSFPSRNSMAEMVGMIIQLLCPNSRQSPLCSRNILPLARSNYGLQLARVSRSWWGIGRSRRGGACGLVCSPISFSPSIYLYIMVEKWVECQICSQVLIKSQKGRQVLWMEIRSSFNGVGKGMGKRWRRTGRFHHEARRGRGWVLRLWRGGRCRRPRLDGIGG